MEVLSILDVKFLVYEMNTPIGNINELHIHFKQFQIKMILFNMKLMMIIFVSGIAEHTK